MNCTMITLETDSFFNTFRRTNFDRFPMKHFNGYLDIKTRASDLYRYDQQFYLLRFLLILFSFICSLLLVIRLYLFRVIGGFI